MNKTTTAIRNGKVEFWRFIFSVIIMIHHSRNLVGDKNCMFLGGSLAVEFFFLVSGYLMMVSIEKRKDAPVRLGQETLGYLWRKIKSLFPELLLAHIIAILFVSYAKEYSLFQTVKLGVSSFFELTLVKMSGIYSVSLNGVTWYISTMLLCMAVLYPLIRKFPDIMTRIVAPLVALLLLGYLSENFDAPRNPLQWIGATYKGNLRGMAELCLGIICYLVCKQFSGLSLTKFGKYLVTIAEWACYLVAIWYMYTQKASHFDYFVIAIIMAGVILSFSHQGIDAALFDRPFFAFLGKCSMPLFLCHTFFSKYLNFILPENWTNNQKMVIYVLCSVVTAALVSTIAAFLRRIAPKVRSFAKKLLIKK